jgi:hypothetical protein
MEDKNYIYKKLSDGRYIKEIDNKTEHLATAQEDAKLATDIRSLLQGPQGDSGTSGTSGESGTSGINGAKGDMGRTGLTGPRGLNGTSGSSGSSGQDGTSGINGQDGTSGINGRKGDKGDKGDRGFPGLQGPSGQNGSAGVSGTSGTSAPGITSGSSGTSGQNGTAGTSGVNGQNGQSSSYFLYKAKANTYTGNPAHTYILWNNATQTGATAIHINHLTKDNIDVDIFLGLIREGSNLTIQHTTNSGEYQTWNVSATPTLVSGANNYWIVPVTLINSTISFTNNTDIFVAISADSGTSGSSGSSGSSGTSGSSGLSSMSNFTTSKNNIVLATATASPSQNYTTNLFGVPATSNFLTNYTMVAPFVFDRGFTFSSITVDFTGNGGVTTATFSFALYTDNGSNYPSNLLFSSVGYQTTVGLKQHIVSGTISQNTKYWIAYRTVHINSTTFNTVRTGNVANLNPISIGNIGVTSFATGYYVYRSSIGDGFPSTWASQLYAFSGHATPVIGFL